MSTDEFMDEVHNSGRYQSDFFEIYQEFQTYQYAALRTLLELHRVCELHQIEYQLAYGSLLGVIRDGGQIPWDYDIDVILPFEEKQRLIAALDNDLGSEFYYYCPENNDKCRHMIMRLAPREYRTEALHVDVFFLIGTPEDDKERRVFEKRIKDLSEKRYGKFVNVVEESVGSLHRFIHLLVKKKLPAVFISIKSIDKEYQELCSRYASRESAVCISADSYADWCEYPTDILWKTKLMTTDFGEIRIPVHYDELLKVIYGDYMSVPPIEKRMEEVLYNHHRIKFYNKRS